MEESDAAAALSSTTWSCSTPNRRLVAELLATFDLEKEKLPSLDTTNFWQSDRDSLDSDFLVARNILQHERWHELNSLSDAVLEAALQPTNATQEQTVLISDNVTLEDIVSLVRIKPTSPMRAFAWFRCVCRFAFVSKRDDRADALGTFEAVNNIVSTFLNVVLRPTTTSESSHEAKLMAVEDERLMKDGIDSRWAWAMGACANAAGACGVGPHNQYMRHSVQRLWFTAEMLDIFRLFATRVVMRYKAEAIIGGFLGTICNFIAGSRNHPDQPQFHEILDEILGVCNVAVENGAPICGMWASSFFFSSLQPSSAYDGHESPVMAALIDEKSETIFPLLLALGQNVVGVPVREGEPSGMRVWMNAILRMIVVLETPSNSTSNERGPHMLLHLAKHPEFVVLLEQCRPAVRSTAESIEHYERRLQTLVNATRFCNL